MDLSYTIQDPPSIEMITNLLCEIDIGALKVEVEIKDVLKGEIPFPVQEVLKNTIELSRQWRQEAWGQVRDSSMVFLRTF